MKRIFLVGSPRSGTTLLQSMLYAGGELYSMPETHYFRLGIGRGYCIEQIKAPIYRFIMSKGLNNKVLSFLSRKHFINSFFFHYDNITTIKGKEIWLEKTPDHLFSIREIRKVDSNAHFIYMNRNAIDVIPSMIDMWKREAQYKTPLKRWLASVNNFLITLLWFKSVKKSIVLFRESPWLARGIRDYFYVNNFYELNKDKFITINYDALLENTQVELKALCKNLGINYRSKMLDFKSVTKDIITTKEVWKSNNSTDLKRTTSKFTLLSELEKKVISEEIDML